MTPVPAHAAPTPASESACFKATVAAAAAASPKLPVKDPRDPRFGCGLKLPVGRAPPLVCAHVRTRLSDSDCRRRSLSSAPATRQGIAEPGFVRRGGAGWRSMDRLGRMPLRVFPIG